MIVNHQDLILVNVASLQTLLDLWQMIGLNVFYNQQGFFCICHVIADYFDVRG